MHANTGQTILWDRYARLSPSRKLVLRLKSLLLIPTTNGELVECLKATGRKLPEGKSWSFVALSPILDELVKQGLLTRSFDCPRALLHAVAADAAASDDIEVLVAAIRRVLPARRSSAIYYSASLGIDINALYRLLRIAVYINDEAEFVANRDCCDQTFGPHHALNFLASIFLDAPLSAAWLANCPPAVQALLLEAKLLGFLSLGGPSDTVPELIALGRTRQNQQGYGELTAVLQRYDLLCARLDQASDESATPADYQRLAFQGSVAFLEGRNDEALKTYRDALKLRRKLAGRRKLFLPYEYGVFFLLALLRTQDSALHAEIQTGLDAAMGEFEQAAQDGGLRSMQALLWLVQGAEAKARAMLKTVRSDMPRAPVSAACVAVVEYAVDPGLSRQVRTDLQERFEQLRDVLPLAAGIYAEILTEIDPHPGPYKTWLAEFGAGNRLSFTRLIESRLPWQRALESLDGFLNAADSKGVAGKTPRKGKRLAWFVDPVTKNVEVVEQSAKGRDGWTDGRPVAMKRLHEQDPRLDYLTLQDRLALRTIRKAASSSWYGEETFDFDSPCTIAALVGHPAVFDARQRSQPLELVAYPVELLISEKGGGYRVALSHTADEQTVFLEAETPARYRVVEFSRTLLVVQEILGERGLTVPAAARDQVVSLVRRNSAILPIRNEIAEMAAPGSEGEATPVAQLVPYESGLKLTLLVRPFGADGPAYLAGLGGRSVLASVSGQQRRANRDLPRELAERNALVQACPTLRDRGGDDVHELVVEDLEGCLELLLELRSYTGPVAVEWPEGRKMRVSPVEPGKLKLRVAQDRDWFSVDGTVALDEDEVLEMRFLLDRLDRMQGRFVPLGDGKFVALTRQLQAQLQRLAAVSEPAKSGRRVHALGAPALDAVLEDAGEVKADAAWKRHVGRIRAAEGWTPALPSTLQAELRDYQVEGFVWMSRLARWGAGACLADDMGLGKTVQAIAVMLDRSAEGPILVVAPTSVCPNWQSEIARFAPTLRTHRLTVDDRAGLIAGLGAGDVLVCSYGLLHQSAEELGARRWDMVVLDEAQAIKNAETKRAQATATLQAGFRLALTGTPVENYLDELWSLFNFVNPGVLGSREGFQKRFAKPIERDRDPHARQALRALIRPFLLRRTKAAVLSELPPRTEQTMTVEMADAERTFYEALRQQSLEKIAALDAPEGRRKIQILAEITRLRRACCNPGLIDAAAGIPSGKLASFLDLVDELIRNRHRALVFSQFVGHLDLVRAALDARGIRYEYLDGSTPSNERERRVAAFQAGGADLFLISLRAGGTGLNLTAADYVVHLDPWWNPAVEDQASDRAHRIGQERPVTIYRLIMQDSIEERILRLHRDKRDLASDILEGGEVSARLSEEALLDLIRG